MLATFYRVYLYSSLFDQLSEGFKIFEFTPLIYLGYAKLKIGRVLHSALDSEPS